MSDASVGGPRGARAPGRARQRSDLRPRGGREPERRSRSGAWSRGGRVSPPALALLVAFLCLGVPGVANAHPLGNFTVNHLSEVSFSSDAVRVHYVLDQAEIPTFRERREAPAAVLAAKRAAVERGLRLVVDGRAVALRAVGPGTIAMPQGQGGLRTTRVELDLRAAVSGRRITLRDETFAGRIGWKAITLLPGDGTDVRSTDAFSTDPTDGLRRYPTALLQSPLDRRAASFTVTPGEGTVSAPPAPGTDAPRTEDRGSDGFAGVFSDAAAGKSVLLLLLLASFGWGALHALSPGHGKGMVAAYLMGTRGTTRDAIVLGAVVTVSHTIGVFALGLVTLLLAQYVLPEDLYPWLNVVSGLLVVVVGGGILWGRVQAARGRRGPAFLRAIEHDHGPGGHSHGPGGHTHGPHDHTHGPGGHTHGPHDHTHGPGGHTHGPHGHTHGPGGHTHGPGGHTHGPGGHTHPDRGRRLGRRRRGAPAPLVPAAPTPVLADVPPRPRPVRTRTLAQAGTFMAVADPVPAGAAGPTAESGVGRRGLLGMGIAAGAIPCPSALVVLLGAIAQQQVALGLLLIVTFSVGLAATLTGLGIAVVHAGRVTSRLNVPGVVTRAMPALSALVILGLGLLLTARALPGIA